MNENTERSREDLLRGALKLQAKLFLDALRDLLLSPVSIGAAALDIVLAKRQAPRYFDACLRFGERSEEWIDLWATRQRAGQADAANVDALLANIEAVVRDPQVGARRALVLKRWAERQVWRARRRESAAATVPDVSERSAN